MHCLAMPCHVMSYMETTNLDTGMRQYDEEIDFMAKFVGIPQGQIPVLSSTLIRMTSHNTLSYNPTIARYM